MRQRSSLDDEDATEVNTILMVVPRRTSRTSVEISLVGFGGAPEGATLLRVSPVAGGPSRETRADGTWSRIAGGRAPAIYHQAVEVSGLAPGTICRAELVDVFDHELARAAFETLPERLPAGGDGTGPHRPFTVWVSSCFHSPNASTHLERVVHALMDDPRCRPHAKFLLGDQVYLDAPLPWTVFSRGQDAMRTRFNAAYIDNWIHPGFKELLSGSATFFMTDDHDYWNNYPELPIPMLSSVRLPGFWNAWDGLARERIVALQGGRRIETFEIGPADGQLGGLSFFLADTRIDRSRDGERLMSDDSMDELVRWLETLDRPGVLAMGQPLIALPGDDADWHLPGYRQYRKRLLPAVEACGHDLVVLAGDAHFGRVAVTATRPHQGRKIVEVVSSPLALISPRVGSAADTSLRAFPCFGPPADRRAIEYVREVPTYAGPEGQALTEEHGMTVSFWSAGGHRVGVRIRPWFVREGTDNVPWVWETELE